MMETKWETKVGNEPAKPLSSGGFHIPWLRVSELKVDTGSGGNWSFKDVQGQR
jgi:hypothetical protein